MATPNDGWVVIKDPIEYVERIIALEKELARLTELLHFHEHLNLGVRMVKVNGKYREVMNVERMWRRR